MYPIIYNADYLLDPKLMDSEYPIEIHVCRFSNNKFPIYYLNSKNYKILFDGNIKYKVLLLSNEPACCPFKERINDIIKYHKTYDLILCTDKEIIKNCSNAILFPYGGTWLNKVEIQKPDSLGIYEEGIETKFLDKKFQVSFLSTNHIAADLPINTIMPGYDMRKLIWNSKEKIKTPTIFWSSTRYPTNNIKFSDTLHDGLLPNDIKDNLFYSQFTIVIENCVQENYFSEKLIDALLTKTIPIYFGCPNIHEFFNIEGMLIFKDFDEFLNIINKLDESSYETMKEKAEINFNLAKPYGASFSKRVHAAITEHMNNKNDILFSIGILTVPHRKTHLDRLMDLLNRIIPLNYKNSIEIIVNSDNMIKTVGEKRNEVIDQAKGKYLAFIDDDDIVSDDYFDLILPELEKDIDGVSWYGLYYVNNTPAMVFNHANKNAGNFKKNGKQYRPLNHLNPIKTSIVKQIRFPEKSFREDSDFSDRLLASGLIKTESDINKVLYHYLWSEKETLTQGQK